MGTFANNLTAAEEERLAILVEECGEVCQIVGKILRHGYESVDPTKADAPTNRRMLEKELGDVQTALLLLRSGGDVDGARIASRIGRKLTKLDDYTHYQDAVLLAARDLPGSDT